MDIKSWYAWEGRLRAEQVYRRADLSAGELRGPPGEYKQQDWRGNAGTETAPCYCTETTGRISPVHALCSAVKAAPGQSPGKDGETELLQHLWLPTALASCKTVQRKKEIAPACLPCPAHSRAHRSLHPPLGKMSEGCLDISALECLRKNGTLFFS